MSAPVCKHCRKGKVNRPRGLCWSCYYTPGVRDMYPSTSKYAHRGVGHGDGGFVLPPAPTPHTPGSPEKEAVLIERAANKQSLWHPLDGVSLHAPGRAAERLMSERGIYARALDGDAAERADGRTVLLAVPGRLIYLTPAEAEHLAGQLCVAAEVERDGEPDD